MRRTIQILLVAICISAEANDATPNWDYMANTAIHWYGYGKPAFELAKKSGHPVFVLVYSNRCSWCERYEKEVLETPQFRHQLKQDFIPVAVSIEKQRPLAKQLKANLVPTTLVLAPDGTKLIRFHGMSSAKEISETLEQVLAAWRQGKLPMVDDFGTGESCCPIEP